MGKEKETTGIAGKQTRTSTTRWWGIEHESLKERGKTIAMGLTRTANDGSPGAGCGAPAGLSIATACW